LPGQRTLGECCTIMLGLSSTTKRMGSRGVQEPRRKSRRRPLCSSVRRVVHPHRVTSPVTLGLLTCKFAGHCQCDGCYIILGRLLQLVRSPVAQVPQVPGDFCVVAAALRKTPDFGVAAKVPFFFFSRCCR